MFRNFYEVLKYDPKTITTQQCKIPFDIETDAKKGQLPFPSYIIEEIRYCIFDAVAFAMSDEFGINITMD